MRATAFAMIAAACLQGLASTPLRAQGLAITAPYGDENGCKVGRGEQVETDDFRLLRPDGTTTYARVCEFVQTLTAKDGSLVVTGLCDEEGEEGKGVSMFSITRSLHDPQALAVYDGDGTLWGEVKPCP